MRGMSDESIDLIYLDPPFNSNHNYAAPIGSRAAGAAFKDTWNLSEIDLAWHGEIADSYPGLYKLLDAVKEIHGKSMMAYLIYMSIRVMEMKRILRGGGGGIYLHCDPTASHYLKLMMDEVFGKNNFRNEIVWSYKKWSNVVGYFQRNHDILLFYTCNDHTFNVQRILSDDKRRKLNIGYQVNRPGGVKQLIVYDKDKAAAKIERGDYDKVVYRDAGDQGTPMSDTWNDINILNSQAKERTGYPTQKPLVLLERIIKASSNEGDMILDPFCGCATTCVAAEKLGRKWIGIDVSEKAVELVIDRVRRELGDLYFKPIHRTDIPTSRKGKRSPDIKHSLFGKQEGFCRGCGVSFPFVNFTIDHVVPRSKGGGDTDENLQLLCGHCNSVKGNRSQEYLISQLAKNKVIDNRGYGGNVLHDSQ